MNTEQYLYANGYTPAPVRRRRRRRRRRPGLGTVICLAALLAVLIAFAVGISAFGHSGNEDGNPTLRLPETVQLKQLNIPSGAVFEASELVTGLEGTGIAVSFVTEPAADTRGVQSVELRFMLNGAECIHFATVNRFQLVEQITVQMGSGRIPDIRDFVPDPSVIAGFKGDSPDSLPEDSCGSHTLTVECDGREYPVTYLVTEDIPPEAVGLTVTVEAGSVPEPATLVDQIEDHSDVTVTYAQTPVLTTVGTEEVVLVLTDAFGNTAQVTATVEIIPNENGPQFTGLEELQVQVGSTVSYKTDVSATDLQDGELTFTVDPGDVDAKTVGSYTAWYTATDSDGNSLTVPRTVVVLDKAEIEVEKYAQEVLSKIITEDMTRDEQIYAVYRYTRKNVTFVGTSDKFSIARSAYEGFSTGKGDCYTYYAMNVVLFNALGIENLEVARVGGTSNHWWNLVLFEDGLYYHVDSCPKSVKVDGMTYDKMSDSDLDKYTNNKKVLAHRSNYYTYDKTLPEYQDIDIAP